MKAVIALVFLGIVALSSAGVGVPTFVTSYGAVPAFAHHVAAPAFAHHVAAPVAVAPITYTAATYATGANYKLHLDTSLPGSAYAAWPNAAAPTAYGYGVIKTL